ncbi:hypothetical protein ID866_511 [Astraeus odoratus]|nr:hypothetical protein ID866_511 [Astraeus odoratus]
MSTPQHTAKEGSSRPSRLQSSPSLPNLRERNGPSIPHTTQSPPTSQKPAFQLSSLVSAISSPKLPPKDGDLPRSRRTSKTQHYLTPPLTPSSSMKSDSTDLESAGPAMSAEDQSNAAAVGDVQQSRFLLASVIHDRHLSIANVASQIKNVPRDVSEDVVDQYLHSLTSCREDASVGPPASQPAQNVSLADTPIQTIDFRLRDRRTVVAAFYDVRNADRVYQLISKKQLHSKPDTLGKGRHNAYYETSLGPSWEENLTCLFLSPGHFFKLLGESARKFMTHSEGMFCVSVSGASAGRGNEPSSLFASWNHSPLQTKLRTLLSKYGDVKTVRPLNGSEDTYGQPFFVEYFDVRAAKAAMEGVDERVVDNIKLRLIPEDGLLNGSRPRDSRSEETSDASAGHLGSDLTTEPKTPAVAAYLSPSLPTSTVSNASPVDPHDIRPAEYRPSRERSILDGPESAVAMKNAPLPPSEHSLASLPYSVNHGLITDNLFPSGPAYLRGGIVTTAQVGRRVSNNALSDGIRPREPYKRIDGDRAYPVTVDCGDRDGVQAGSLAVNETSGGTTNLYCTSYSGAQPQYGHDYFSQADRVITDAPMHHSWVSSLSHNTTPMQYPLSSQTPIPPLCYDTLTGTWVTWPPLNLLADQWSTYPSPSMFYSGHAAPGIHYPYSQQPSSIPVPPYLNPVNHPIVQTVPISPRSPPENNQLDIQRIEQGLDTRTTVMIKNIPNKMTDRELIDFINNVCPRRIDFLYLRMDFQNGCNVGYAFVNFINVEDLLRFAKAKLNERWNMYSSEKVLQMSYANYQGKEALVEKFKNSCIMDEREEWRPKIFFSEPGPKQGLPEEFPKPTHIRRKERSSVNRGALFVPGIPVHQRTLTNLGAKPHEDGTKGGGAHLSYA